MYAGVFGTIMRYNDSFKQWEVAIEASPIRAEIPTSLDSYSLGINDWKITGDKKCLKSLEKSYETKVGISIVFSKKVQIDIKVALL